MHACSNISTGSGSPPLDNNPSSIPHTSAQVVSYQGKNYSTTPVGVHNNVVPVSNRHFLTQSNSTHSNSNPNFHFSHVSQLNTSHQSWGNHFNTGSSAPYGSAISCSSAQSFTLLSPSPRAAPGEVVHYATREAVRVNSSQKIPAYSINTKSCRTSYLGKNYAKLTPNLKEVYVNSCKTAWLLDTYWKRVSPMMQQNLIITMPKAGDLHKHLSGCFTLCDYCAWIQQYQLWNNPKDGKFYLLADGESKEGFIHPNKYIHTATPEANDLSNAIQCIDDKTQSRNNAATKFFRGFEITESILAHVPLKEQISKIIKNADEERLCYQELMHEGKIEPPTGALEIMQEFEKEFSVEILDRNLTNSQGTFTDKIKKIVNQTCEQLKEKLIPFLENNKQLLERIQEYQDCDIECGILPTSDLPERPLSALSTESGSSSQLMEKPLHISDAKSPVTVRIIREIDRCQNKITHFFWDVLCAHVLIDKLPHLVSSLSPVGFEADTYACKFFKWHMVILRYFKESYKHDHLSVHCGEVPYGLYPKFNNRVQDTVELSGATRLGHASNIVDTTNLLKLFQTLRDKDILIEIPLSSNQYLGGYRKEYHPACELWRQNIPTALAVDDSGSFCTTYAKEFSMAHQMGRSYRDLVQLCRNSLQYSTLEDRKPFIYTKDEDGYWEVSENFLDIYNTNMDLDQMELSPKSLKIAHYERSLAKFEQANAETWLEEMKKNLKITSHVFDSKPFNMLSYQSSSNLMAVQAENSLEIRQGCPQNTEVFFSTDFIEKYCEKTGFNYDSFKQAVENIAQKFVIIEEYSGNQS